MWLVRVEDVVLGVFRKVRIDAWVPSVVAVCGVVDGFLLCTLDVSYTGFLVLVPEFGIECLQFSIHFLRRLRVVACLFIISYRSMRLWVFIFVTIELFGSIADTYDTDAKYSEERYSKSEEDHSVVNIFTEHFAIILFLDFKCLNNLIWSRKLSYHLDSVGKGEHDVVIADTLFLELSKQAIVVVLRHR